MLPTVSIIIATYNYGRYICKAIDSILNSSFPTEQIGIIVVDDGSTDNTEEQLKDYRDRITFIYQQNSGKAHATQVAIDHTSGKYIFNLDADDWFLPEKIQTVVDIFEADPEITHVGHPAIYFNVDTQTESLEHIPAEFLGKKMYGKTLLGDFYRKGVSGGAGSTFAARAETLKQSKIPPEVDMYIDEYMFLASVNQGYSFFVQKPLSVWRIHGNNFTVSGSTVCLAKIKRSLNSIEAVFQNLPLLGIDEKIKYIYQVKMLSVRLAFKEQSQEKKWGDILNLWSSVLSGFGEFGLEVFSIAKHYYVYNRSLPTPIIRTLKKYRQA
jgi:glycosyltransferase involved in cell wall biosynthesis